MDSIWETKFDLDIREGLPEEVTLEIRSEEQKGTSHGKAERRAFQEESDKHKVRLSVSTYQGTERDPG